MKCTSCKKGSLKNLSTDDLVEIEGGPSIRVLGLKVLKCSHCGKILMNSVVAAERTRKVLAGLLEYYAHRPSELPGKVSLWMRKAVDLPSTELAEKAHLTPSAFAHAEKKNSYIDHFAALVLLARVADFVSGGTQAQEALRAITELDQLLDPSLLEAVEVIPHEGAA